MNDYKKIEDILAAINETWINGTSLCRADYLNNKIKTLPSANVIELNDIYRLIAGHSIYSGDSILSAFTCLVEGKEVKPIKPLDDMIKQKCGTWVAVDCYEAFGGDEATWYAHGNPIAFHYCSNCKEQTWNDEFGKEILSDFCPNCGADMRGNNNETD